METVTVKTAHNCRILDIAITMKHTLSDVSIWLGSHIQFYLQIPTLALYIAQFRTNCRSTALSMCWIRMREIRNLLNCFQHKRLFMLICVSVVYEFFVTTLYGPISYAPKSLAPSSFRQKCCILSVVDLNAMETINETRSNQ